MEIRQSAFDSIQIELEEFSFFLRYNFYLDGEERIPESIMLRDNYSTAYFLNATVRDFLVVEETSLAVERTWSIQPKGGIGLCFRLDFPELAPEAAVLPGFTPPGRPGRQPFTLLGSRLACPSSLFLLRNRRALFLFADLPESPEDQGGIGLESLTSEDGPLLRVEFHFPARESPVTVTGPRPTDTAPPTLFSYPSAGDFRRSLRLNLVSAPAEGIRTTAMEAALQRFEKAFPVVPVDANPPARRPADDGHPGTGGSRHGGRQKAGAGREAAGGRLHPVDRALAGILQGEARQWYLLAEGGIRGVRVTAGSRTLSSYAGAALALLLLKLTPAAEEAEEAAAVRGASEGIGPVETALRLADFTLKGQHPAGPFFETYDLRRREWVGLRGTSHLVGLEQAASIAHLLFLIAAELERLGRPGLKYRLAARRLPDAFLEPRGELKEAGGVIDLRTMGCAEGGLGALELVEPLLDLHRLEGGELHRKALDALAGRYFPASLHPLHLPASREGREPDAKAALLLLRAGLTLREAGVQVPNLDALPELLFPWIYLNRDGGRLTAGRRSALLGADRRGGAGAVEGGGRRHSGGGAARSPGAEEFDPVGGLLDSTRRNRLLFQGYELSYLLWRAGRSDSFLLHHPVEDLIRLLTRFTAQVPLGTAWYAHSPWGGDPWGRGSRGKLRGDWPRFGPVDSRRLAREALFLLRLREEFPEALSSVVLPRGAAAEPG